tara:strand:+ start:758 stop:904 length:147 start_codon:yes stop_codon:yes gene_type:complete
VDLEQAFKVLLAVGKSYVKMNDKLTEKQAITIKTSIITLEKRYKEIRK